MIGTRSSEIPIPQNNNYNENNNIFDPTNSSPPNEFIMKLRVRSFLYSSSPPFSEYSKKGGIENKINESKHYTFSGLSTTSFYKVPSKVVVSNVPLNKLDNFDKA